MSVTDSEGGDRFSQKKNSIKSPILVFDVIILQGQHNYSDIFYYYYYYKKYIFFCSLRDCGK
jgi:hypothetical protein